jgi:prepilin-type processing-associated H-X9-DG protein
VPTKDLHPPFHPSSTSIWPPGNVSGPGTTNGTAFANKTFTIGYYARPVVGWSQFNSDGAGSQSAPSGGMPHFSKMKNAALFADFIRIGSFQSVKQLPHGNGLNVVYADGSGQVVRSDYFLKDMITANTFLDSNQNSLANPFIMSGSYPTATGIWGDFDKAH